MLYSKSAVIAALMALVCGYPVASNSSRGVVEIPLKKEIHSGPPTGNLSRRALPDSQMNFTRIRYYADYTIGGQTQVGILDTGSSDVWTYGNQEWSGGYNPDNSSTYQWVSDDFQSGYGGAGNNRPVSGTWALDTIGLGGAEVPSYPFAYLNESVSSFPDNIGIFGIGPKKAESPTTKYPTYVERLRDAGTIQSNSFSLYTDKSGLEATLLLGGIDTAKYQGPLYTLDFDTTDFYGAAYYAIDFTFQGVQYTGGVLDSGTASVLLPRAVADSVASDYGAYFDDNWGGYVRTSPPPDDLEPLVFEIGGVNISIPGSDIYTLYEDKYMFAINRNVNQLLYQLNILGDSLLRQLYLFFDNDNNEVAFAPINLTDESNVIPVSNEIPSATPAPDQGSYGQTSGCIIC